jgi:hypothetical protein
MLSVVKYGIFYCYADCHYTECCYAEFRLVEYRIFIMLR